MLGQLIWGWLFEAFHWILRHPRHRKVPMSTYGDLLAPLKTALVAQATSAQVLASAEANKTQDDSTVASTTAPFAAALKVAPGGFVVDDTVTPYVQYSSPDGVALVSTPISSINDPVPSAPDAPPAGP